MFHVSGRLSFCLIDWSGHAATFKILKIATWLHINLHLDSTATFSAFQTHWDIFPCYWVRVLRVWHLLSCAIGNLGLVLHVFQLAFLVLLGALKPSKMILWFSMRWTWIRIHVTMCLWRVLGPKWVEHSTNNPNGCDKGPWVSNWFLSPNKNYEFRMLTIAGSVTQVSPFTSFVKSCVRTLPISDTGCLTQGPQWK